VIIKSDSFAVSNFPAFIVLDGVNGAGKSTLQAKLAALFATHNKPLHCTREPGATNIGARIRELLLGNKTDVPSPECELLLFGADRAEHVAKVIKPKIAQGCSVLSDRYYYSTVAFQGYGRGMDLKLIETINAVAIQNVVPDLFILLDLDPRAGLLRKQSFATAKDQQLSTRQPSTRQPSAEHDRFEHEALAFQERMRAGFLAIANSVKEPCLVVDAALGAEDVYQAVVKRLHLSK